MGSSELNGFPRCVVDYSLDIAPAEIVSLTEPVNTLLKTTYLLGITTDLESTFQSLFDLAEEIAGVDSCAFIRGEAESPQFEMIVRRGPALPEGEDSVRFLPATLVRHHGKVVLL